MLTAQGGGLTVTEQNFDFDLLTPQKLLEKSVGSTIRVIRTNPTTGADTSEDAKVLSVAEGMVVLQIGDRIETAIPGRLVFSAVAGELARAADPGHQGTQRKGRADHGGAVLSLARPLLAGGLRRLALRR